MNGSTGMPLGRLSFVGTVANLVAVAVVGLVMLYGRSARMVAGAVAVPFLRVMVPVGVGVRWIDAVATFGAALSPSHPGRGSDAAAPGMVVIELALGGRR